MANASRVGIYCEKHASAAYPSNPRMSSTHSTTHPGIFHDIPQLRTFDNKCEQAIMKVQTWIFLHDARLLPHFDDKLVQRCSGVQTRIFYTMQRNYALLTTDATREGIVCLQTIPNCEAAKFTS